MGELHKSFHLQEHPALHSAAMGLYIAPSGVITGAFLMLPRKTLSSVAAGFTLGPGEGYVYIDYLALLYLVSCIICRDDEMVLHAEGGEV